jgi:hypothetical protein
MRYETLKVASPIGTYTGIVFSSLLTWVLPDHFPCDPFRGERTTGRRA